MKRQTPKSLCENHLVDCENHGAARRVYMHLSIQFGEGDLVLLIYLLQLAQGKYLRLSLDATLVGKAEHGVLKVC